MKSLSKMTDNLLGQPMFKVLQRTQLMERAGRKVIHYEIGDPSFNSPLISIEAAKKALDDNMTHYTSSMGLIEFREAISEYINLSLGFHPSLDQILVCPANTIIDFVIRCVVNPGEEVIYPDPGFPTYYSVLNYNGMVPVGVQLKEENGFRISSKDIEEKITKKTRLMIINSPNNPTGSMISEKELRKIANIAKEYDLYLLSDEVYSKITYEQKHYSSSLIDLCKERTIILNSLSKEFSMSGWRLGYAVGPEKLISKMGLLLQTILSCLPAFTQLGGLAVLKGDKGFLKERNLILKERRDILIDGLNTLSGIECSLPEGAFYVFPSIKNTGLTSDEYCEKMLVHTGVCLLPGNCFGKFGEGFIRLCYASTPKEVIKESIFKMQEFHNKYIRISS